MVERALRFAVLGTGFWAHYQIPAWFEVGGVELVALYNRTGSKAEQMAHKFNVPKVYVDAEQLLKNEMLDFVDIITEVPAHAPLVHLAAQYRVPVICQKPMGPDYETCQGMVRACQEAGIPFMIHENFRWQTPLRAVKRALVEGRIGRPFRARLQFMHYTSFHNQPLLKHVEHLILTDLGSHLLDLVRFYFGEPRSLYCQHLQVRNDIAGEDVASVVLRTGEVICHCEMSFSSRTERGRFPETLIYIEGTQGTLELGPDYWLRITTEQGTWAQRVPPPLYPWVNPDYAVAHSSIVPCNRDLLRALKTGTPAETSAEDNLKTMRLVYAAYEAAAADRVIQFNP